MKRSLGIAIALCLLWADAPRAGDRPPFPVDLFPVPFRSVADGSDLLALHYNPAGLGIGSGVEFGWYHQFSGGESGGNNAIILRARNFAGEISWLKHPVYGSRREYVLGLGHMITQKLSLGASWRYIKTDDDALQNRSLWTIGATFLGGPMWTVGARWENPFHTEVNGQKTNGTIVSGIRLRPRIKRLLVGVDWFWREQTRVQDTELRLSAAVWAVTGINAYAWGDTEKRVGIELRFLVERSSGGAEVRFTDWTKYGDGTFYLTVLHTEYENAKIHETDRNTWEE